MERVIREIEGFQSDFVFLVVEREREKEGVVRIVKSTNCDLGESDYCAGGHTNNKKITMIN